ncbi:hypothetical protein TNCV_1015891 [Trichonephila clavipes]|uniref:Uncharacterized protein n=1 Tax=Trichonephila clavipes TaxID=2585209 RepID=A0A8X7BA49_TRICX|nr:hypothetical protein TNCV_1015891 [Trichonephila clavipes]
MYTTTEITVCPFSNKHSAALMSPISRLTDLESNIQETTRRQATADRRLASSHGLFRFIKVTLPTDIKIFRTLIRN